MSDDNQDGAKMKLFVWADPYDVSYGSTMVIAIAETVERAREIAKRSPGYAYGKYGDDPPRDTVLGEPTRVVDLPCAEWHMWSE